MSFLSIAFPLLGLILLGPSLIGLRLLLMKLTCLVLPSLKLSFTVDEVLEPDPAFLEDLGLKESYFVNFLWRTGMGRSASGDVEGCSCLRKDSLNESSDCMKI